MLARFYCTSQSFGFADVADSQPKKWDHCAERKFMKLIKVEIELLVDDDLCRMTNDTSGGIYNKDCIASYLNNKLYNDPEFFGEFSCENISSVENWE